MSLARALSGTFLAGSWALSLCLTAGLAGAAETTVGFIEIEGALHERHLVASPFGESSRGGHLQLRDLLAGIDEARSDATVGGLVIRLKDAELKSSQIAEIGAAVRKVREGGKRATLFADAYANSELLLGSFFDEVLVQQGGEVSLPGVYMEEMFLKDMFNWVGVTPDFVQIGDYKGASEQYANAKPSKAWDENINALLDQLYGQMRAQIKQGRKLDDKQLDAAMEQAWMADAAQAQKLGLIDGAVDLPDLEDHLKKTFGTEIVWANNLLPAPNEHKIDASNPFAMIGELQKMFKPAKRVPKRDTIAVVHIDGAIVDGDSGGGGLMSRGGNVGSRTIRRALSDIEENDKIKGVVVRIDSPGGSAIASEVMWQGLRRVAGKKPVWASVGSMAASGGYYCLVGTDKVYVTPHSIVGSIGVVGGKMALGGVYEKLKINVVPRGRGPRAGMFASATPWSDAEKTLVKQRMTETYNLFTQRVSAGRKGIDLSKTAEGRLFVGAKAVELKMADELGGLSDAIEGLAGNLALKHGQYDVMDYPEPKGFDEVLSDLFESFGGAQSRMTLPSTLVPMIGAAREVVGAKSWDMVAQSFDALMQLRKEPVILMSPSVLIEK